MTPSRRSRSDLVRTGVRFVTGTDTGVGKTVVTAALVAAARAAGRSPYVVKPAQTGVGPDEAGDLAEVRRLVGGVPGHEGVRLRAPLAPATAARLETDVPLPGLGDQVAGIRNAARWHDAVLVEGAGGLLVEVGDSWTLLDLADALAADGVEVGFVVVARAGLGTLNHAALTVLAIQQRGLTVDGLAIGSWPVEPGLVEEQNLLDLPRYTGVPVLGRIPDGAPGLPDFAERAPGWLAVPE